MFFFLLNVKKATCGFGHTLKMKTNIDPTVLSRNAATVDGKLDINFTKWYDPRFIPGINQQHFLN